MADGVDTQLVGADGSSLDPNQTPDEKPEDAQEKLKKDIESYLKGQIESAERELKNQRDSWKRNVELRQGKPNSGYASIINMPSDDYQSEYNPDWYLTKAKMANLFSQVPKVTLTHLSSKYGPAVGPFSKALNYEIGKKRCNTGAAMTEVLADVVNASGIGAIHVGYAARFTMEKIPAVDTKMIPPQVVQSMIAAGTMPMKEVPAIVDARFFTKRISPADLLKPQSFTGSDYNDAPWIGERFRMSWSEGKSEWDLDDDLKDTLTQGGGDTKSDQSLNTSTEPREEFSDLKQIQGKRIYYWRYRVDPDCLSFTEIWEVVWLDGKTESVYHDHWKGQKYNEETKHYIGSCRLPIQVGTTTYISDNPAPPSDSQVSRPQVNDLRRSRSQMFQNRAFSVPVRWFNTDKTDPMMHDLLMRGQVQAMIPVQGDGSKAFGEIARASYPSEDLTFDRTGLDDLFRMWMMGPNQVGMMSSHDVTKGEVDATQAGFSSVIGYERGRMADLFLGVVEVLAGLMALYSDFPMLTDEERQAMMSAWDNKHILHDLAFSILPDSQVATDSGAKIKKLTGFLNITAKSGFVNVKKVIAEIAELHGLDPNEYIVDPQPHPVKPAGVSFSFRGKDDLQNPVVVAILAKNQQMPSPEEVSAAQKMLIQVQSGQVIQPPPKPGMPPGPPGPRPLPPPNQDHMPQWGLANKVAKRSRDIGGGGR